MSVATFILGESGTGKSASLRNFDPSETLLIQIKPKPLPFKASGWKRHSKDAPGNIVVGATSDLVVAYLQKTQRDIIIIDDFQYLMAGEFFDRAYEKGYDKFTEIARHAYDVLATATTLPDHKRVYMLCHTDTDMNGKIKAKTIGRMLDEKLTVEGLVSIVLRTAVINGQYLFTTKNSGNDTTKSPMGMFDDEHIENDLKLVDEAICAYYDLTTIGA
ncbi:AAA domain-containing protein [Nitrosospira multiformis]|uniref:AAA domain-containing protein n=1 Tax=Nitrosospira multiformis TaxID=1231 RepID=A0A1H8IWZ0_9PROT|nr:AAA family ATPase [Nitrosospira multiformis]SEN72566.1 AAA domain-containing protein [Nitrosospira multiformis]